MPGEERAMVTGTPYRLDQAGPGRSSVKVTPASTPPRITDERTRQRATGLGPLDLPGAQPSALANAQLSAISLPRFCVRSMKRCRVRRVSPPGADVLEAEAQAARLAVERGHVLQAQVDVEPGVVVELHANAADDDAGIHHRHVVGQEEGAAADADVDHAQAELGARACRGGAAARPARCASAAARGRRCGAGSGTSRAGTGSSGRSPGCRARAPGSARRTGP